MLAFTYNFPTRSAAPDCMTNQTTVRIFISSPSDVRPERLKAEQIVARLDREFAYHFHVEAVLWEREPLVATHHFQDPENIPQARSTDIVVVILWSRLGVILPPDQFRGAISGRPVTGTEWEFEDALAAAREKRTPDLLLYRKTAEPVAGLGDRSAGAGTPRAARQGGGFHQALVPQRRPEELHRRLA